MANSRKAQGAATMAAEGSAAPRALAVFAGGGLGTIAVYVVYWFRHHDVVVQTVQEDPAFATLISIVCLLFLAALGGLLALGARPADWYRAIPVGLGVPGMIFAFDLGASESASTGEDVAFVAPMSGPDRTGVAGLGSWLMLADDAGDRSWLDSVRLVLAPASAVRQHRQKSIIAENRALKRRADEAEMERADAVEQKRLMAAELEQRAEKINELVQAGQAQLNRLQGLEDRVAELQVERQQALTQANAATTDYRELLEVHDQTMAKFLQVQKDEEQIRASLAEAQKRAREAGERADTLEEDLSGARRRAEALEQRVGALEQLVRERDQAAEALNRDLGEMRQRLGRQEKQIEQAADYLLRLGAVTPWESRRLPSELRTMRRGLTSTLLALGEIGDKALRQAEQSGDDRLKRFVAEERRLRRVIEPPDGGP
jgi:hypothetical protein